MTEMIERVARAILSEQQRISDESYRYPKGLVCTDPIEESCRLARAAIEAMREPPRPLLTVSAKAALLARGSGCSQEDAFLAGLRAMINAALETPPE